MLYGFTFVIYVWLWSVFDKDPKCYLKNNDHAKDNQAAWSLTKTYRQLRKSGNGKDGHPWEKHTIGAQQQSALNTCLKVELYGPKWLHLGTICLCNAYMHAAAISEK